MAGINIKVTGIEGLTKKFGLANQLLGGVLEKTLDVSAAVTLKQLKQNTPVDTGNLKDSEEVVKPTPLLALVGPNEELANYAYFVEVGHYTVSGSFVKGQFYVERTALEMTPVINKLFSNAIKTFVNQ